MTVIALIVTGALVALCFDLFRCLRRAYKNQPGWLVHTEDGITLIVAGILLIVSCCVVDYGRLRWYTFALPLVGIFTYFLCISPWFGKIVTFLMRIPGKIALFFSKIILKK